jgi:HSP20 family protein
MSKNLVPRSIWNFPFSLEEDENWPIESANASNLSIYEDENHVFVEAAIPGLKPEEIEVTFEKGILWIKAERRQEEEDKKKKYYRKAVSAFSYRVAVPGQIDTTHEPDASYKDGIMKVVFNKTKQTQPKKITVKHGK